MTSHDAAHGAVAPTGTPYPIRSGGTEAVVTELGATLRSFTVDGHDVVRGFAPDEAVHAGHGQHLIPWPNRIRDGRYLLAGQQQQLALSEPERDNAIHGLTRWVPWALVEHGADVVTQRTTVFPQTGWPGTLQAEVTHRVRPGALEVEVVCRNVGVVTVPYGYAAHPYLTVGEEVVDDVVLTVPAARYLDVDERLLPLALAAVDGSDFDLRTGEPLGHRDFDTAFTDLDRDDDGYWRVTLERAGRRSSLWGDQTCDWIQIYTGRGDRTVSIAVEPMTCGPDAFNDGPTADGVIMLEPGDEHVVRWGIDGN